MKLLLDTNVLLRFYLADVEPQFQETKKLISAIEAGQHRAYTSSLVFLEISYVLAKLYRLPKREVVGTLQSIQKLRGLTILEKTNTKQAMRWFQKYQIKFTDCLIASQLTDNMVLVTFDREFNRLPVNAKQPNQIQT